MSEAAKPSWYRIENRSLPTPTAVVYLHDEIGAWGVSAQDFARDLRSISASRIKVHINSRGGSVFDGLAIHNALRSTRATIETHNDALAASIASVIFQAGDRRVVAPHSRLMIHDAMVGAEGNADEIRKVLERLEDASSNIADLYASRAGQGDSAHWRALMKAETWFTEEEAVAAGLADAVGLDEDDDEKALAMGVLLNMPRHEVADFLNTGAVLAPANLEKLHSVMSTLSASHAGACDLGDSCPVAVKGEAKGDEPANRHDARRREVDAILAGFR